MKKTVDQPTVTKKEIWEKPEITKRRANETDGGGITTTTEGHLPITIDLKAGS